LVLFRFYLLLHLVTQPPLLSKSGRNVVWERTRESDPLVTTNPLLLSPNGEVSLGSSYGKLFRTENWEGGVLRRMVL
jgi:hypothetical protein